MKSLSHIPTVEGSWMRRYGTHPVVAQSGLVKTRSAPMIDASWPRTPIRVSTTTGALSLMRHTDLKGWTAGHGAIPVLPLPSLSLVGFLKLSRT